MNNGKTITNGIHQVLFSNVFSEVETTLVGSLTDIFIILRFGFIFADSISLVSKADAVFFSVKPNDISEMMLPLWKLNLLNKIFKKSNKYKCFNFSFECGIITRCFII